MRGRTGKTCRISGAIQDRGARSSGIERENRAALLPGHETLCLGPARAAQTLKHDSQMWAVRDWMKFRGAPRKGGLS